MRSALNGNYRVCRVREDEDGNASFKLLQSERILKSIEAPFWGTADTLPEDFFAYRGDLDNDGVREIVITSFEAVSNGMGVTYATVHIFSDPVVAPDREPLSFPVEEFGSSDNFIYNTKTKQTEILVSYWEAFNSLDPRRDWGTYLVGKWFRYQDGKLLPLLNKPTLARRFLNSFARIRDNGWYPNRFPYTWLKDKRTHKFYREPIRKGTKLVSTELGVISRFDSEDSFEFLLENGTSRRGYSPAWRSNFRRPENEATSLRIDSIGFWSNRYVLPRKFNPLILLDSLEGKRVRIETFQNDANEEFSRIWLLEH